MAIAGSTNDTKVCGPSPFGEPIMLTGGAIVVAILVIAALGMHGAYISPSTLGWTLAGLSGGVALIAIAGVANSLRSVVDNPKDIALILKGQKKGIDKSEKTTVLIGLIFAAVLLSLSSLTAVGIMPSAALGWCIFSPLIGCVAMTALMPIFQCFKKAVCSH